MYDEEVDRLCKFINQLQNLKEIVLDVFSELVAEACEDVNEFIHVVNEDNNQTFRIVKVKYELKKSRKMNARFERKLKWMMETSGYISLPVRIVFDWRMS